MSPLPTPLVLLIALQARATVRRWARGLRRPKGILALLGSLALLLLFLLPAFVSPRSLGAAVPEVVAAPTSDLGPFVMLGFVLLSVLGTPADRALVFTRAEVDFLFTGPFLRRQLLLYTLARRVVPIVGVSFFLAVAGRRFAGSFAGGFLGMALLLVLLNLTTICAAMAAQLLGQHRFRTLRWILLGTVVGAATAGSWWLAQRQDLDLLAAFKAFTLSTPGRILALPTMPFARTLAAESLGAALLPWGLVALGINVALLLLIIRLDADWLEASADSSRKVHERLQRVRAGGAATAAPARFASVRIPMPPRLGGVGPLAWRQATSAVRGSGRSLWIFLVIAAAALTPLFLVGGIRDNALTVIRAAGPFVLGYLSLFAPQILRLDFRGDIDRLELLKALPVGAVAMAVAQTAVAGAVVTLLQVVLFIPLSLAFDWRLPALPIWILVALAANMVNVGLDNAAFLLWPHRHRHAPGMNLASGQMLIQTAKLFTLMACLALAAGPAALVTLATPAGIWAGALVALLILALEAALAIWIVSILFRRLDPAATKVPE